MHQLRGVGLQLPGMSGGLLPAQRKRQWFLHPVPFVLFDLHEPSELPVLPAKVIPQRGAMSSLRSVQLLYLSLGQQLHSVQQ